MVRSREVVGLPCPPEALILCAQQAKQVSMWAVSRSGGAGSSIDSDVTSAHVIESHNFPFGCTTTLVYEMVGGGGPAFVALIPSFRLTADG